jgi:hypothetical protein
MVVVDNINDRSLGSLPLFVFFHSPPPPPAHPLPPPLPPPPLPPPPLDCGRQLEPQRDALMGAHEHAKAVAAEEGFGNVRTKEDPLPSWVGEEACFGGWWWCMCIGG